MSDKILGLRKVVSDLLTIPRGFMQEVWADRTEKGIEVWTSAYVDRNSWTEYKMHPEYVCLGRWSAQRPRTDVDWDSTESHTASIKRAVEQAIAEGRL